jgi:hypothetical protein
MMDPKLKSFMIIGCQDMMHVEGRKGNSQKRWVSELISHESRSWNEAAVRECCFPRDAEVGIKLSARITEDFLAWNGESNGLFSVRSTYQIVWQQNGNRMNRVNLVWNPGVCGS